MTRIEAYLKLQEMPDYSGMCKVLRKGCWNTISEEDTDWYVDYVHNVSMSSIDTRIIDLATPAHHMQTIHPKISCSYRPYNIEHELRDALNEANEIPLNVWLKAGVPPNGRTKKQHILIQQLNKKKRGR